MDRYRWRRRIESLDPLADHQEIYRISVGYEFPWDYTRALELALFRTYCVPSISRLLAATREFELRPQRRYDDTALLMSELTAHGYDSPRGKEALRVVNRMHGRYAIDNDDMVYVLSTFVYEPIAWLDRYGWRRLTEHERLAAYHFYREVGARMGIRGVPDGFEEFRAWKEAYEIAHFRYADTNRRIGDYTLGLLAGWYPRPLRPAVRLATRGMLDARMLDAFGFRPAPRAVSALGSGALKARALAVRLAWPARKTSRIGTDPRNRTYPGYPEGYQVSALGAPAPPADLDPTLVR